MTDPTTDKARELASELASAWAARMAPDYEGGELQPYLDTPLGYRRGRLRHMMVLFLERVLPSALTAAREEGGREMKLAVAKSVIDVLIPADPHLAEKFLHDFNERAALSAASEEAGRELGTCERCLFRDLIVERHVGGGGNYSPDDWIQTCRTEGCEFRSSHYGENKHHSDHCPLASLQAKMDADAFEGRLNLRREKWASMGMPRSDEQIKASIIRDFGEPQPYPAALSAPQAGEDSR